MTPTLDTRNRWAALGMTLFILGGGALIADQAPAIALINESPSLPRGLYGRIPGAEVRAGSTVAVPQPVRAQAYLSSLGMPREVLLIKRVVAVGGDAVCFDGDAVMTPVGRRLVLARDRQGTALPRWAGCRRLAADELFLLGDTAGSFDSRYFGPVRRSEVYGVYREVVTW